MASIIKTVGIKDLKNRLSSYVREVRGGVRILVTDRETVVAELRQPAPDEPVPAVQALREWARQGLVELPSRRKRPLPVSPVRLPDGTALAIVDELRREGGQ